MMPIDKNEFLLLINFFSIKKTAEQYEEILQKFASEDPVTFVKLVRSLNKAESDNVAADNCDVKVISDKITAWTIYGFERIMHKNSTRAEKEFIIKVADLWAKNEWSAAKDMIVSICPQYKKCTDDVLQRIFLNEIFSYYFYFDGKISAIKFYRTINACDLRRAKDVLDEFWVDAKHREEIRD